MRYSEKAKAHVPNLVCLQTFCALYENVEDGLVCLPCGNRRHSLWDLLSYMCDPRPWADKIVTIAYNAKSFDLHCILKKTILL